LAEWLLSRRLPAGGFFAVAGAPIPDLPLHRHGRCMRWPACMSLSTDLREPCLDFVDSLWTNRGGFYGHWSDEAIDTEYTYYAFVVARAPD